MIAEAALGIAGGVWIAVALAGFRRVHNWQRAARLTAIIGAALAISALAGALLAETPASAPQRVVMATAAMVVGGSLYSLRSGASTLTLLAGGLLLTYVTLTSRGDQTAPPSTVGLIIVLTSSCSLPALEASVREWQRTHSRFGVAFAVWVGSSAAAVVSATLSLVQRGAWFGSTPGDAGLIAAWVASSGSLLVRPGRLRAVLLVTAALSVALNALSL